MATRAWRSFSERLTDELASIEDRFLLLLDQSAIINVDPNRGQSAIWFAGAAEWGWRGDEKLISERTSLLDSYGEWLARFRLLHRSPLPEVAKRLSEADKLMRGWLERGGSDHTIPATIDLAAARVRSTFEELRSLLDVAVQGQGELLAVPDTNVLLRDPDTAIYHAIMGTDSYTVVLIPTVLAELDTLKDRGRTVDVREAADRAVRRLKGLRDRGDLRAGVTVERKVRLRSEHRDTNPHDVLGWLDPTVPDDRILGAALDLQSRAPSSLVVLVTSDFNLQNKAAVAGLPFVEPPKMSPELGSARVDAPG